MNLQISRFRPPPGSKGSERESGCTSIMAVCLRNVGTYLPDTRMTRPQSKKAPRYNRRRNRHYIGMDISGSMMAMDFKPNRIEASKNVAMEFIDGRPNDRIGLVIFSGEAFLMSAYNDHAILKNLSRISKRDDRRWNGYWRRLATALNRLRAARPFQGIILLTDGVTIWIHRSTFRGRDCKFTECGLYHRYRTTGCTLPLQTPFGSKSHLWKLKSMRTCSVRFKDDDENTFGLLITRNCARFTRR